MFWFLAIAITAIACAALYYAAAGNRVNAALPTVDAAVTAHFAQQLREIDADVALGRLGEPEAVSAKAEIAREVLRLQGEAAAKSAQAPDPRRWVLASIGVTAVLALGTYNALGRPDLPASPLASRSDRALNDLSVDEAIAQIEARLKTNPDDIKGWSVIGPAYMQLGRFADAATAFRHVNELAPPTADSETNLAEALMMANNGEIGEESRQLLESAAARDPAHVRSRFYLAGELTRAGDFKAAIDAWTKLLALGKGDEAWVATANEGLAAAQAGLNGGAGKPDDAAIRAMVEGLSTRLEQQGGTVDEWTRLVRSRLVLGEADKAQAAYDKAREAHPDAADRAALDVLAADSGLKLGSTP